MVATAEDGAKDEAEEDAVEATADINPAGSGTLLCEGSDVLVCDG